ncbi:MAG: hypothetical protein ACOYB3_02030 [Azonexus sp.]
MPPKKRTTPPPIDRPLSRAYLRAFTGWSTAHPPGTSEPNSLRIMENMMVDRNQALQVRPGLRYLSFANSPDINKVTDAVPGKAVGLPMVGTQEPFYTATGDKALLFAVRETDQTVGFRCILFSDGETVVHALTSSKIGFTIPQGTSVLNFSSKTTHVEYLQIDNKIVALSDAGEAIRVFFVGAEKVAKKINSIEVPAWADSHKLSIAHPIKAWIDKQSWSVTRNEIPNPSFESGVSSWSLTNCTAEIAGDAAIAGAGSRVLKLTSAPTKSNIQTSPLESVDINGYPGWHSHKDWGDPDLSKSGPYMKITDKKGKGTFLAYGSKLTYGVAPGQRYVVALDYSNGTNVVPIVVLTFYNAAGAKIGASTSMAMPYAANPQRFVSPAVTSPESTVAMRVSVGGRNQSSAGTFVKAKSIVLCKEGEDTAAYDGNSGTNYSWMGAQRESASVFHPPVTISIASPRLPIPASGASCGSGYIRGGGQAASVALIQYDKNGAQLTSTSTAGTAGAGWSRISEGEAATNSQAALGVVKFSFDGVVKGASVYVDATMLENGVSTPGAYYDGDTTPTSGSLYAWDGAAHLSPSIRSIYTVVPELPVANTPAPTSLVSSDATKNVYKVAAFYTFENEVGESAASMIGEIRVMRPWSNWLWQLPSATSEPTGGATTNPMLCADQLTFTVPSGVYAQALVEGATKWNLYVMSWSDQEPVPVVATLAATQDLRGAPLHKDAGWLTITPQRKIGLNDSLLPTENNRENYSRPPRSRSGLVAGDRLIMVGDPTELGTIRWTSNRPGEYLNFTPSRGGGAKTLTTGNLHIPADVVLWQNPQSVDTLAILCMGSDGRSISYYMQPANINAQSGSTSVMGFEETTSTPGTLSPYANEVLNNSLYRPLDRALLKSTASNYNINHKTQTDKIANMWQRLWSKHWMMSAQLDNRLYYLVHNPLGAVLESGCKGNEIWVYDISSENGHWSRFLVQANALRVFNVGPREVLGVTRPDGLYYLDSTARVDDYVGANSDVLQRPIPWRFETNTQGANRAHDAWAHVQQVGVTLGNFLGSMRFGVRGYDLNGFQLTFEKEFTATGVDENDGYTWDVDDVMLIRRDMKEWFLFGSSVDGAEGWGSLSYAQYRYTPVSVNVGYEYGSIETFEYGSNPDGYSLNGIPLTYMDYTRP